MATATQLLRETWFWTSVFTDHATILHDNLAPEEAPLIEKAQEFKDSFEELLADVQGAATAAGITGPAGSYALTGWPNQPPAGGDETMARELSQRLLDLLAPLRQFKQLIVQRQLECAVKIHVGPSLVQHMIIEADEAQRVLTQGPIEQPVVELLHQHLVWLRDSAGHAAVLHRGVDATEVQLEKVTQDYREIFDALNMKAIELTSMLLVAPRMVAALQRLTQDALAQGDAFRQFLHELREHLEGCTVLGTLTPLLAEHMLKEELYYMEKLLELRTAS